MDSSWFKEFFGTSVERGRALIKGHFGRYVLIGGTTFVIDTGLLIALHKVGLSLGFATTFSYWVAVVFNFSANRHWTFQTTRNLHGQMVRYGLILGFNYLATLVIVLGLTKLGFNFILAKVAAVAVQMCWNYFAYKLLIFT